MTRAERLERLLDRSLRRATRRKVTAVVASALGRAERAETYVGLYREADALARAVWTAYRAESSRGLLLVAHDEIGAFVVERDA